MSYQRIFVNAIADILLLDDWHPQEMIRRIYWLLQSEPSWAASLVDRIHSKFHAHFPEVTKKQITDFIINDRQFMEIWSQHRHQMRIFRFNLERPSPHAKLNCDAPTLQNLKDLTTWLGLSFGQLENYAANWRISDRPDHTRLHHYHYHWLTKPSGKRTLVEAPKQRLADVQRQISLGILDHVPLHSACHGFRKKHSCQTYAKPHAGKSVVIHMDLERFFMSIPFRRIHAMFKTIGYREAVSRRLAGLCCNQTPIHIVAGNPSLNWTHRKQLTTPHLPQGSPSSPALANLCAYKLDLRLAALAEKFGADYTRYADDLAFSGDSEFARIARKIPVLVAYISATEGFTVNHHKTRIMHQGVSQRLTGMTVNRFPNYPRKDYDRMKAVLYNCAKFGPESQNKTQLPHFRAHLYGQIAHVKALNPGKAEKLLALYKRINWAEKD